MVYASPGATATYSESGQVPDGTVLVKEVFEAVTVEVTTGTVSYQSIPKGWFVTVKDSKIGYPDNKLREMAGVGLGLTWRHR